MLRVSLDNLAHAPYGKAATWGALRATRGRASAETFSGHQTPLIEYPKYRRVRGSGCAGTFLRLSPTSLAQMDSTTAFKRRKEMSWGLLV